MDYIAIEVCETCKGIIDGEHLILLAGEFSCRCDWWSDTDLESCPSEGPEQREKK